MQIVDIEPSNINALNSIAYCIKYANVLSDQVFMKLTALYERSLLFDQHDVEANFNMGLLYLQHKQDMTLAL